MPFSLGQILGGWRKKGDAKKTVRRDARAPHSSLTKLRGERPDLSADLRSDLEEQGGASQKRDSVKNKSDLAWRTIVSPHISEKGTALGEGRYVFKAAGGSNKPTIKRAIEERYGVAVARVHVANMPAKPRRRGQAIGEKPGFKKAIIALKEGQNISEF